MTAITMTTFCSNNNTTTTYTSDNKNKKKRTNLPLLAAGLPLLLLLVITTPSAHAAVYNVSADGSTSYDIYEAMDLAEAGDTVSLANGTYDQAVVSVRDGADGSPITVTGGPDAIINGHHGNQSVLITHSFITIQVGVGTVAERSTAAVVRTAHLSHDVTAVRPLCLWQEKIEVCIEARVDASIYEVLQ